jgi:hypothetical protein
MSSRRLVIYRGQPDSGPPGISWTLKRECAVWFARRFSPWRRAAEPTVLRARVNPSRILAYLVGRDEAEVVLDPAGLAIRRSALSDETHQ